MDRFMKMISSLPSTTPSDAIGCVFLNLDSCLSGNTVFASKVGSRKAYARVLRAELFNDGAFSPIQPLFTPLAGRLTAEGANVNDVAVIIGYVLNDTLYASLAARLVDRFDCGASYEESAVLGLISELLQLTGESAWDRAIASIHLDPSTLQRAGETTSEEEFIRNVVARCSVSTALNVQESFDLLLANGSMLSDLQSPAATLKVLLALLKNSAIASDFSDIMRQFPLMIPSDSEYQQLIDVLSGLVRDSSTVSELSQEYAIGVIEKFHGEANLVGSKASKLPDGSSIDAAISGNLCVVDRTSYIPFFLSTRNAFIVRPRRFGKSLWLSVLRSFFSDPRSLSAFAINQLSFRHDRQVHNPRASRYLPPRPVLYFDFSAHAQRGRSGAGARSQLYSFLENEVVEMAKQNGVTFDETCDSWSLRLKVLIRDSAKLSGQRIVVLIDEYDSFLIHSRGSSEIDEIKDIMSDFFRILKSQVDHILLRVTTGITKWNLKTALSGANDVIDLTFDSAVCRLFGFTDVEVVKILKGHGLEALLKEVREGCNGYCFNLSKTTLTVYNPFYIGRVVATRRVDDYWHETAPSIASEYWDLIRSSKIPTTISREELISANPEVTSENPGFLVYLGYATIKEVNENESKVKIGVPNPSTERCLLKDFLAESFNRYPTAKQAANALRERPPDWVRFGKALSIYLLTTPYEVLARLSTIPKGAGDPPCAPSDQTQQLAPIEPGKEAIEGSKPAKEESNEADGQIAVSAFLSSAGFGVGLERTTSIGRCDICVKAGSNFIVMELKCCRKGDSVQTLCVDGVAQIMRGSYKALDSDDKSYARYGIACVLDSKGRVLRSIMTENGVELQFSTVVEGGVKEIVTCDAFPPSNRFYMESFYAMLCPTAGDADFEKRIRLLFRKHEFNALSLIGLGSSDISPLVVSLTADKDGPLSDNSGKTNVSIIRLTDDEIVKVIQVVKTKGPTAQAILELRPKPVTTIEEFCEFFKDFCRRSTTDEAKYAAVKELKDSYETFIQASELLKATKRDRVYEFKQGMHLAIRNTKQLMQAALCKRESADVSGS